MRDFEKKEAIQTVLFILGAMATFALLGLVLRYLGIDVDALMNFISGGVAGYVLGALFGFGSKRSN